MLSVSTPAPGGGTSNEAAFVFANSLNYPRLVSRPAAGTAKGEYTGIALVNLSPKEALLTFTAYDRKGELMSGAEVTNPIALALVRGSDGTIVTSPLLTDRYPCTVIHCAPFRSG
jgi:hypothetical protein